MNKFCKIVVIVTTLALCGCATGYHSATNPILGFTGGYWDEKGPGRLIKVGFNGNGFISNEKVGVYLLYRCAEVAKREGSKYFILYSSIPSAISDHRVSERAVSTVGGKPMTFAYILLTNEPGQGVLSSSEVISRLMPELKSTGGKFR
ncbi:MAG: hypothetical protein Q8L72_02250 [Moraxellaceae bacterium]|nr:hypothetical protein [Moraxellaceae bacterium]